MLLLLLFWMLFGGLCFLPGHALLVALRLDNCFSRNYDRALVSLWLGMVLVAPLFLAVSLFFALKPLVAVIVFGGTSCLSLGDKTNAMAVRSCLREITLPAAAGTMFIAIGTAAYASQFITLTDSGLYHIQAIKWLAEYGAVPGLALLHDRLGFTSSWFALTAPLDHGAVQSHAYSFTGGFVLFTMIHALGVSLSRIAGNTAQREDVFLAVASLLSLPPVLFWRMGVSPSPDLPVIVLTIGIAWIYLQVAKIPYADGLLDPRLLPLLLALGAVTIKLSAVPLAVIAGLIYGLGGRARLRRLAVTGCLAGLFLVPPLAANTLASGYPLFPSALVAFDLPWTLPVESVRVLATVITEWARWGGRPTPAWGNAWNWIVPWIGGHLYYSLGVVVSLGVVAAAALRPGRSAKVVTSREISPWRAYGAVTLVALSGIVFSLWKAPDLRFGLGYLVVMPAVFAAVRHDRATRSTVPTLARMSGLPVYGMLVMIGVAFHVWSLPLPAYARLTDAVREGKLLTEGSPYVNWIMPPAVVKFYWKGAGQEGIAYSCEKLDYQQGSIDALTYNRPEPDNAWNCWDAPLPCTPDELRNVGLLKPPLGLAAGFSWKAAD